MTTSDLLVIRNDGLGYEFSAVSTPYTLDSRFMSEDRSRLQPLSFIIGVSILDSTTSDLRIIRNWTRPWPLWCLVSPDTRRLNSFEYDVMFLSVGAGRFLAHGCVADESRVRMWSYGRLNSLFLCWYNIRIGATVRSNKPTTAGEISRPVSLLRALFLRQSFNR